MPADFSDKIYTVSSLRDEIGGPSKAPHASTYMSDAQFTEIINRNVSIAQDKVDEMVNNLSPEQLIKYRNQAVRVSVALSASGFSSDLVMGAIDSDTYFPFALQATSGGVEYTLDNEIETTSNLAVVVAVNRYKIVNNEIYVAPNDTTSINVWLIPKAVIAKDLVPTVALEANQLMLQDALNALKNRVSVTTMFKEENKTEAP